MGLLTVIRKCRQREREMRFLVLGLDNAGKTTVVRRLQGLSVDEVAPTLGFQITSLEHRGYKLHLFDIGGQSSIRCYWRNYYEQTDALIWVVDSGDRQRLDICRQELHALLLEERLAGASLLVLANKQDLPGALSVETIKQHLQLDSIVTRHWHILACAAVGKSVQSETQEKLNKMDETTRKLVAGVDWVVNDVASRLYLMDS